MGSGLLHVEPCRSHPPSSQGRKFLRRFDAVSYVRLTQLLDTHDLGRPRGGELAGAAAAATGSSGDYRAALRAIVQRVLVVGIASDLLYPVRVRQRKATAARIGDPPLSLCNAARAPIRDGIAHPSLYASRHRLAARPR